MLAVTNQLLPLMKRAGLYRRLKASVLHDFYWSVTDRRWIDGRRREVDFYRNVLTGFRPGDQVFDVGANEGAKVDVFLRLGARVIAVEPDRVNQKVLRDKFIRYRLFPKPVLIIDKALSDKNAIETMWIDGPGSAVNTMSAKWVQSLKTNKTSFTHGHYGLDFEQKSVVETVTLDQLILTHGIPFFVKIDVEGYEINVLRGLHSPVPFVSFEVNLPDFKSEGLECVKLLKRIAPGGTFNYAADCQSGLILKCWLGAEDFSRELHSWSEGTIEVFWQSSLPYTPRLQGQKHKAG